MNRGGVDDGDNNNNNNVVTLRPIDSNTLFIYNARYPDKFPRRHVVFRKFKFEHELDASRTSRGLPGSCYPLTASFMSMRNFPCALPNVIVPVRACRNIGEYEYGQWPRVYRGDGGQLVAPVSRTTVAAMLGTSFVACRPSNAEVSKRTPVVPNMNIKDGSDAVSNTACLKLNFDGVVEPIWLGRLEDDETPNRYVDRLTGIPRARSWWE